MIFLQNPLQGRKEGGKQLINFGRWIDVGVLGGGWTRESGGGWVLGDWIDELVYLVCV